MILSTLSRCGRQDIDRLRIGCFPIFSGNVWINISITDQLNSLLLSSCNDSCLIYPLDWSYDAADIDSISDMDYLCSYAGRIDLNILITVNTITKDEPGYKVELNFYDLDSSSLRLKMVEMFDLKRPSSFFGNFLDHVENLTSHDFSPVSEEYDFIPKELLSEYGKGRYYYLNGKEKKAAEIFRSLIRRDSTNKRVIKCLAAAVLDEGLEQKREGKYFEDEYLEIERLLYREMNRDSSDAELYRLLGMVYIQRELWTKASSLLLKAYELEKNDPYLYFALSRLHPSRFKETGFRSRESLLKHALLLNPAYEAAWISLADYYYYSNRPRKAERSYLNLLSIHPASMDALLGLGRMYHYRNEFVKLIGIYEKILEIDPECSEAYYNLGIAYYNNGKIEEAARFFKRAIKIDGHTNSYYYLGVIYEKKGEMDRAMQYYKKRLEMRSGINDLFADQAMIRINKLKLRGY